MYGKQFLISHHRLILSPNQFELHIAGKQIPKLSNDTNGSHLIIIFIDGSNTTGVKVQSLFK